MTILPEGMDGMRVARLAKETISTTGEMGIHECHFLWVFVLCFAVAGFHSSLLMFLLIRRGRIMIYS
jgi:hypothetical protein